MEKYSFRTKIQKISQLKFGLYSEMHTSALLLYSSMPSGNYMRYHETTYAYIFHHIIGTRTKPFFKEKYFSGHVIIPRFCEVEIVRNEPIQ